MKQIILFILSSLFALHLSAQCNSDTHSTANADSWISCQVSLSPNTNRPLGHWFMIDLGNLKRLGKTHIWNQNSVSEAGIKRLAVDVSNDGVTWQEAKEINLNQAAKNSQYEGEELDSIDAKARYVLFFVLETYGDGNCAGLSEIKLEVKDVMTSNESVDSKSSDISIAPNPAHNTIYVDFGFEGDKSYQIISMAGNVMYRNETKSQAVTQDISFLNSGMYILQVRHKKGTFSQKRFIVL